MIYLDNAATSWPKPESVYRTQDEFARKAAANPGRASHRMAVALEQAILDARHHVARLFNAEGPARIVFTLNATDALNIAIKGVLRPGDHVITTGMEHNSVNRPLDGLERAGAIACARVPCGADGVVDPAEFRKALTPKTRLIVLLHGSNVTGMIQPVAEVARIAHEAGALLLADASQTAGAVPIDVQAEGIDLLACPGHKALYGPQGTGVLYVRRGVEVRAWREGGTGTKSEEPHHPEEMPEHLEGGTPNAVGIVALGAGVKYIKQQGQAKIRAHEQALLQRLLDGLQGLSKVRVFGAGPADRRLAVVSFVVDGFDPQEVGAVLDESFDISCRTGLHCAPGCHKLLGTFPAGTVRFSLGAFNTPEEVDRAVKALGEMTA
jgi:cysteine desulfurase family protein